MKSFFKTSSLFILFASALYGFFLFLSYWVIPGRYQKNLKYSPGGNGHLFTRLKEADTTRNVDVLILGSSHAYRGYDTRLFKAVGLKAFNLGSSAQTPVQTEVLVDKYLDRFDPEFVIIDVFPVLMSSDGIESTTDLLSNEPANTNTFCLAMKSKNVTAYNTLIFDLIMESVGSEIKEPIKKSNGDIYIPGGYIASSLDHTNGETRITTKYHVNDDQMDALQNVVAHLKTKRIPYVLIQSPIRRDKYQMVSNNKEIDRVFAKLGPYYNFNETISLSGGSFLDASHLNQKGVNVFNKRVLELVLKKMPVKNDHSEPLTQSPLAPDLNYHSGANVKNTI